MLEGYVIVPPVNRWDEKNRDKIWDDMGYPTFGKTPAEAWRRFIHPTQIETHGFGTIVQRWHDRGYRIKKARLEIIYDE